MKLQKILERNRRQFFVGRERELADAECMLQAGNGTRLLFCVAPGGYGKSTLLAQIEARAVNSGHKVARIDARHIQPTPLDISRTFDEALSHADGAHGPALLIIDTFEQLKTIETWFHASLLPQLPSSLRLIIAGRNPPHPRWRMDPSWIGLMRVVEISAFSEAEVRSYLQRRGISESAWARAWDVSRGNPLLLALVADVCEQLGPEALGNADGENRLQSLMLGLVREGQSPPQQRALLAASIARTLSRPLLAAMLPEDDAEALYAWLTGLSFMSAAERGLFPHDLIRDALFADAQRRDPEEAEAMIRRAESFYAQRLVPEAMIPLDETFAEITYLSRHGKSPAQLIGLMEEEPLYADVPLAGEVEQASLLVKSFQGEQQQRLFEGWHTRQPQNFTAVRNSNADMRGFVQFVDFGSLTAEETAHDPVVEACRRFVEERGLPAGRQASLARFWLEREQHLSPSSMQPLVMWLVMGRAVRGADYCGMVQQDDEISRTIAAAAGHDIIPGAELMLGDTPAITTLHDWRREPVAAWMVRTNRQIRGLSVGVAPSGSDAENIKQAIRQALRDFTRPDRLKHNPLLTGPHAVLPQGGKGGVEALRRALLEASETLLDSPKTAHYHDILKHSYFSPECSRLSVASVMNMSPSTYYRHLAAAVNLLSEILQPSLF